MKRIRELLQANTIDVSDHDEIEQNLKDIENVWNMAEIREKKMHTTIDGLNDQIEELESEVSDAEQETSVSEGKREEAEAELESIKENFKIESHIDELKVEALQRLYKNTTIDDLQQIEELQKAHMKWNNKIYQDF